MGAKIKIYIQEEGLKFKAIADRVGIPLNIFSAMLNGKRKITADEYVAICRTLNVPLEKFVA